MKRMKGLWLGVLIVALCMPALFSQAKLTGEIAGTAVTENGESLPGVNIVLTGEKMFQKQMTAVTNENGQFRFLRLNPGQYEIEFSLPGFNTVKITKILVSLGQTTPVKGVMAQAALQTEVVVMTQAPLIETKNVQISTNYTTDMIADIPTTRDVKDLMQSTAGINDSGAYGAGGRYDGEYFSGSSTTGYLFNGVDVSETSSGVTWIKPNYDTIEEIQVVGVGASAEYGNFSGAVLNVVTKAGSNKFHGGMGFYYTDSSLQGDNSGGIVDLQPLNYKYDGEASLYLGGPIVKEKLFFFVAGGYNGNKSIKYGDPEYGVFKQPHMQGRLDWVPGPKHQLSFVINSDPLDHENLGLKYGSGTEIGYTNRYRSTAWNASWQFIMSEKSILSLKYAGFRGKNMMDPNSDSISLADYAHNRVYGSAPFFSEGTSKRDQVNAMLTHYADNFLGASHEFKFGAEYEHSLSDNSEGATGDPGTDGLVSLRIMARGGMFAGIGWTNYTFQTTPKVDRFGGFVQDNIQIGKKINVNLGLRYDRAELRSNFIEGKLTTFESIAPRLGFTYDITGDAKNVLRASYGRYSDKTVTGDFIYAFKSSNAPITAYVLFYPDEFIYSGPESIADFGKRIRRDGFIIMQLDPSNPFPIDKNITSPYSDVINFGYERALGRDWAINLDYIYRQDRNFIAILDATDHTYEARQWTDPNLGKTITVWDQTDSNPSQFYYGNSKFMKRRHHMAMLTLKKRPSANWSMMASVVYQDSRGNVDNTVGPVDNEIFGLDTDPQYTQNPYMWGKLTYCNTWQFKMLGSYQLPWGINASGVCRVLSGYHWAPTESLWMSGASRDSATMKTFLEPRGSRTNPWNITIDLRLSKSFAVGTGKNLELIADVFNLLNRANGKEYSTNAGMVYPISGENSYGKAVSLYPPFGARFGIRLTF